MIPELRRAYNAAFTAERYAALQHWLDAEAGLHIPFRICETPLFLPSELAAELEHAAHEIVGAISSPDYLRAAARAVPPGYEVPGEDAHPVFLQVDLALAEPPAGTTDAAAGRLVPRLIELQGFPSLYAFQWLLAHGYRRHFDIPAGMGSYFGGIDDSSYAACLRQVIVGDADPRTVVLLEVEPEEQKTRVDFVLTEKLLGVPTVGLADVAVRGRQAFYRDAAGVETPIRRIYNRVIFDELERRGMAVPPLFRDDLDVEWVGHPNWYWKISKFSLPFLHSQYVPPCHFLSDLRELPPDLDHYVLKPLFSFAGHGVEIGVTAERLRAIERPEDYILQRRIQYGPAVVTPDVPAMAEVRMMFVWGDRPRLINNLVRMTKGKMVGVDYNKDRTWVGASVALHGPAVAGPPAGRQGMGANA
jgi:hypothetical protein